MQTQGEDKQYKILMVKTKLPHNPPKKRQKEKKQTTTSLQ